VDGHSQNLASGLQIQTDRLLPLSHRLLPLKLEGIRDNRKGLFAQMCGLEVVVWDEWDELGWCGFERKED
jgi:hypothetical protein